MTTRSVNLDGKRLRVKNSNDPRPHFHLTRRPWKNPLLVVFCLMLAVSPCSATFCGSECFAALGAGSASSPGPLVPRLAGGIGGMWLDMGAFPSMGSKQQCLNPRRGRIVPSSQVLFRAGTPTPGEDSSPSAACSLARY